MEINKGEKLVDEQSNIKLKERLKKLIENSNTLRG